MRLFFIGVIAVIMLVLGFLLFNPQRGAGASGDVLGVSIHWHPELRIFVRGEEITIPQNVGLGARHSPIHTHEDLPIIHLEFQGPVRTDDVRLGKFFEVWGKDMRSFGTSVRMTVNGVENTEYEAYVMRHEDKIELHYD